jgi:hypothetical protein
MSPRVELGTHPRGQVGAWRSVWKTAEKAASGRRNVWVRKWAIDKIREAGSPTSTLERARAIYDGLVREKIYVPDPVDAELIVAADCVVADCEGLTLNGGDCDDLVVALVAAWESVGIRAAVVAHRYEDTALEHVLASAWDGHQWHYADPSARFAFGTSRPPSQEVWVSVPELEVLCDRAGRCDASPPALKPRVNGDFVGVGSPPSIAVGVGQPATGGTMATELVPLTGQDLAATQAAFAAVYGKLRQAQGDLVRSYLLMRATREAMGKPVVDQYVYAGGEGQWTQEHEDRLRNLDKIATVTAAYSKDAADGKRRVETDQATGRTGPVAYSYEPAVYVKGDGEIILTSNDQTVASVIPAGFVGAAPQIGAGVVIIVIAATIAGAIAVVAAASTAKDYIERRRRKDLIEHQAELSKRYTPQEVERLMRSLGETAQQQAAAQAETQKHDPLTEFAQTAKIVGISVVGLGAAAALVYAVSAFSSRRRYGGMMGYPSPYPMLPMYG